MDKVVVVELLISRDIFTLAVTNRIERDSVGVGRNLRHDSGRGEVIGGKGRVVIGEEQTAG